MKIIALALLLCIASGSVYAAFNQNHFGVATFKVSPMNVKNTKVIK